MQITLPILGVVEPAVSALSRDDAACAQAGACAEVVGCWGAAKTLVAVQTAEALGKPLFVLTPTRIEAEGVFEDLVTFLGEARCALFPAWEVLPSDTMQPADDIVAERMDTLMRLCEPAGKGGPMAVVAPVRAVLQEVAAPGQLARNTLRLAVGHEHDLEDLVGQLTGMGYERELLVEQRGQVSVRGGILDIFPISAELPFRVEFFGDEIESVRTFEPETQRSIRAVGEIQVPPRNEKGLIGANNGAPITAHLPKGTLVVYDELPAIREEAGKLEEQLGRTPHFVPFSGVTEAVDAAFPALRMAQVGYAQREAERFMMTSASMAGWQDQPDGFWDQLAQWDAGGYTVTLLSANAGERRRLTELLEEHGYRQDRGRFDLRLDLGRIRAGFASPDDRFALVSDREIFGRRHVRRRRRRFEAGSAITTFNDLKPGDYIVHAHHGIGRYLGMRRFEGKAGDFVAVQYSGGDKLYVPVTSIDSVQKYTGGDGSLPRIDKLGGATWARTKARVKKAVRDMTDELLKLYSQRETQPGHAFPPDTPWQQEFEEAFEYEETPDQARAIAEVKRDMQAPRPMDRLVCGDVGYGKTEVALRAAFKAVVDNMQVALLCPTTVLAEQHYLTFRERLADFPMRVDLMSRFRTSKQIKETIEKLKSGEVDVVIGTHRLLSKDVGFKNLGLAIVDEEQRFGVAQKERLKHLRTMVDVLTLTATPIPRTLNLALLGARDMSVINTAPNDRLPVHTCVTAFDEQVVQEAIRRELARQGQVFFVHNRVHNILPYATLIQELVPEARVGIGHGQMPEKDLERVMSDFIHGDLDVLLCTNIIGAGLDIPNANTIIVNNADHFGLAELYQLRGRVGRYKHRAFAYLLVAGSRAITEDAQKRLKALEEFSTLGAGFRIAMRDLEIRGCGNVLGGEQHGHIATVGFETYTQLLEEAVSEAKGEAPRRRVLPPCEAALDAYIPEDYVPSEAQRMTLYKRIAGALDADEAEEMRDEIADRFGPLPLPVKRLLDIMRLRALAADAGVKRVVVGKSGVSVEFESAERLSRSNRSALAHQFGSRLEFAWQGEPSATLHTADGNADGGHAQPIALTEDFLRALALL